MLIVEALLSAVVIALGLVFISRGLGGQLKALSTVEEYETLVSLARSTLLELEGEVSLDRLPSRAQQGTFEAPYDRYRWKITVASQDPLAAVPHSEILLTVERTDRPSSRVQLSSLWPDDWVPAEW